MQSKWPSRSGRAQKIASKFASNFSLLLGRFWGPKWSSKCSQIEPESLPRRSWSTPPAAHCFRTRFSCFFEPLGPLKSMLPCRREHVFQKICFSGLGQKKVPKMSPTTTPKRAQEASRWTKMASQTAAEISTKFRLHFGRFWEPKWAPKWTPKSLKNQLWNPRAAQRPPGSHLGAIWEPFGSHI